MRRSWGALSFSTVSNPLQTFQLFPNRWIFNWNRAHVVIRGICAAHCQKKCTLANGKKLKWRCSKDFPLLCKWRERESEKVERLHTGEEEHVNRWGERFDSPYEQLIVQEHTDLRGGLGRGGGQAWGKQLAQGHSSSSQQKHRPSSSRGGAALVSASNRQRFQLPLFQLPAVEDSADFAFEFHVLEYVQYKCLWRLNGWKFNWCMLD